MRLVLGIVSLVGAGLFLWPFLGSGAAGDAPALTVALATALGFAAIEVGTRRLDARGLALLAALCALAAGLRLVLLTGIGGFSPFFLLVLCAGYALGPSFGFLTGALALVVSAIVTGGIGPWLPYQLFAAGWVGGSGRLVTGVLHRTSGSPRHQSCSLLCTGSWLRFAFWRGDGPVGLVVLPRRPGSWLAGGSRSRRDGTSVRSASTSSRRSCTTRFGLSATP